MLKPNAVKTAARDEAERLRQEFLAAGGKCQRQEPGVAQGLKASKYLNGLKGVVKPIG
jgi:hypothetical protein